MTIHFCFIKLSLSSGFLSTISVVQNWEWVESLNEIAIEPYEFKVILLIVLGILIWQLRGRLYSFTNWMIDLAYDFLFVCLKLTFDFFKLIGSRHLGSFLFICLFFVIFLIKNAPDPARKNYLKQLEPTARKQALKDLEKTTLKRQMEQARTRYVLREMLGLKSRPEDKILLALAGVDTKTKIFRSGMPVYDKSKTQSSVFMLLKLEHDAGYQSDFKGAYLMNLDFSLRQLKAFQLEGVLEGADFSSAHLGGSKFKDTDLRGANFTNARLMHTHFIDCDLSNANFEGANLQSAIFSGSRLKGARFSGTNLRQTFFRGAHLSGAVVDSPEWIENYHRLNSYSHAFSIRWHSVVEAENEQGNLVYVFQGEDPPLKAQKP
ncbi:MAG: pentapeptide repeat-containing protein [Planctomycetes bacterium]|nr:pentapeptide repeat-containing protein [Planctomycetota bacterium]MCH9726812.1 pentapeptide repeat-containing protein [Planctomycetota bacterium]MCH9775496.1 pentapeptide repeat-containing protein [Planctomycetota bacterium]MCH9792646.1 pentapeptide repeat-containing protein [Planctomycetota bacterium]